MPSTLISQLKETTAWLQQHTHCKPRVGIVLGTGLGALVQHIDVAAIHPYASIPHFPVSTVESHKGNLVFGTIGAVPVVAMQGRFHYYEGFTMQEVTYPVRVMKLLGIQHLLLSNAAGGINTGFKKGSLVVLNDHINMQTENPLRGLTDDFFGLRFPDMSKPYNERLSNLLVQEAALAGIQMHQGVYVSVNGPNLETRAEYRFLKTAGADMVGMSTVPEVIVANQLGLPCAAVSVITDECNPDNLQPVDIQEIIAVANQADTALSKIFAGVISRL
ncbi:MAG TPA: purine-nucleoside phosphorylase [Ferruginibacter sp.]|nr:purine-nucleoside phosphorylase [Ferruginibacter sp.]HMP20976.1 purine-nucleoside phosphorylase [Ferruginibacter sp.]